MEPNEHDGQTFAERYPETRGTVIWCIECGEVYPGDALDWWQMCPKCAQWWRDHLPPTPPQEG